MRIFVAAGIASPEIGGPATYLDGLVPELEARGHRVVTLAFGDHRGDGGARGSVRVPRGPLLLRHARYASAYARGTAGADLVLVLSLGLVRPRRRGIPVVLRVAGDLAWERAVNRGWIEPVESLETFQARRHRWRVEAAKTWRSLEARRADRVIVPSEYVRRLVLAWGADPRAVELIPNAVRADRVDLPSPLEARRLLGWDPRGRYLVAAARLTRWKGVDLLIDAVSGLDDVHLVVVGDGPARAALAEQAVRRGVRATFCGALPRPELGLRLRASDYLVVYSAYEGLSHTLLEALAVGTPVVASDRGGNPEVVRDGVNGLLVPHPDPPALAAALHRALAEGVRRRLAAGAVASLERFEWRGVVERTVAALEAAAEIRHGSARIPRRGATP